MNAEPAYRYCEDVTRSRAGNFYYGIRLLPPPKRRALCAVYAFARRLDDIADGGWEAGRQDRLLAKARGDLEAIESSTDDPVLSALSDAGVRFPIPISAFGDLMDGVEMDVRGATYPTFEALEVYCRRVAGSVGRLSVAVFGATDPALGARLADDLGVAMQLTNILRDAREDRARGRTYIPDEDLERFGLDRGFPDARPDAVAGLIRFESNRARQWFDRGLRLVPLLDARSASCVSAMTGIYRRILARLERHPEEALRHRISLSPLEKAWVAARSLAGVGS
jgi:15-cis-phytoene synthase